MTIPSFETTRLLLREISLSDVSAYEQHFLDYEVVRYLSSAVPWPYPPGGIIEYLKTVILPNQGVSRWMWGIFLKDAPSELIGCIDLWSEGRPEHRGFWLGRKFWGQGIMTEAVFPINDYAFNHLGFEKIIFSNAEGNLRSRRIKEKTGATFLGTKPSTFVDPLFTESELWELSKEQWESFKLKGR